MRCKCGNTSRKGRKDCNTCATRKHRLRNPIRYAFDALKSNAKRRGKAFSLTFDEFCKFAKQTDYIRGKGITTKSLTIDRIDETDGYHIHNIRAIPNSVNIRKYLHYKHDGQKMQASVTVSRTDRNNIPDKECQF